MDLTAYKVNPITCGKCGAQIDAGEAEVLSTVACPRCGAPAQVPAELGNILLFKPLGAGSSGVVYHGLDQDLRRNIAVKILHESDRGADREAVLAEARAMAAVNHPNVVKIHTIGEAAGHPYIAMELLTGGRVQRLIDKRKRLSERRSLKIAIDAARGLQAAHAVGLRHQDVKPDNLLMDKGGTAKLLDFGFARFGSKTRSRTIIGTPAYVAPEIIEQEEADFRADIYSLGCTLYHMLIGRTPFGGATASGAYAAHVRETPRYLREVDPKVHTETADAVAKMLQRDPDERHASYGELIEELEAAQAAVAAGPQDESEPIIDQGLREAAMAARFPTPNPEPRRSSGAGASGGASDSARKSARRPGKVDHPTPKPRGAGASGAATRSQRSRGGKARKKKSDATGILLIVLGIGALALIGLIVLLMTLILSGGEDEDARRYERTPAATQFAAHVERSVPERRVFFGAARGDRVS